MKKIVAILAVLTGLGLFANALADYQVSNTVCNICSGPGLGSDGQGTCEMPGGVNYPVLGATIAHAKAVGKTVATADKFFENVPFESVQPFYSVDQARQVEFLTNALTSDDGIKSELRYNYTANAYVSKVTVQPVSETDTVAHRATNIIMGSAGDYYSATMYCSAKITAHD